jgi:endo-1,3(4)-beta-glucanase
VRPRLIHLQVLYDTQWVQNVWSYTMPELVDPTIGDEWKSVIIDAYSNANPQVAAAWSANLSTWGMTGPLSLPTHILKATY